MTAIFVITLGTRDYPDRAVLRRHVYAAGAEVLVADFHPLATAPTVEGARRFLPEGLTRFQPARDDDAPSMEWYA